MSTPPNPPSSTPGPPAEPTGTPVPETAAIPAPAQPLSLDKTPAPAPAAPADAAVETPADAPAETAAPGAPADAPPAAPAPATSLEKAPAPSLEKAPAESPAPPQNPSAESQAPAEAPAPAPAPAAQPPAQTPAPVDAPAAAPAPQAPAPAPAPSHFAPPGPAPAPAPPAGAGYGVPANPWAQPGAGYGGSPFPGYPQTAPATNGLAIAALVLGILGILGGITPFLFWIGALLGLTGLGLGVGAYVKARGGAPRKAMAVTGIALGFLSLAATTGGFYITAALAKEVDRKMDKEFSELDLDPSYSPSYPGYPTKKPKPSPSDIPGKTSALPWGGTFAYPDGVEVTVQGATPYTVGKSAYPTERIGRGVKVTVKITNNSDAAIDVSTALPNARDDQGSEVKMVFDGTQPKLFKGSVMPGQSANGSFVFDVPEQSKSLHFEISPGLTSDYDDAIWDGPIS